MPTLECDGEFRVPQKGGGYTTQKCGSTLRYDDGVDQVRCSACGKLHYVNGGNW